MLQRSQEQDCGRSEKKYKYAQICFHGKTFLFPPQEIDFEQCCTLSDTVHTDSRTSVTGAQTSATSNRVAFVPGCQPLSKRLNTTRQNTEIQSRPMQTAVQKQAGEHRAVDHHRIPIRRKPARQQICADRAAANECDTGRYQRERGWKVTSR